MAEKKTLEERYADDILTNNEILNHLIQCKDCIFRDRTVVNDEECGWKKCFCHIYGKATIENTSLSISYIPIEYEDKPIEVFDNIEICEFYEREKEKK